MAEPETLGDILARTQVGRPEQKTLRLAIIKGNWRSLVGERLAPHCKATKLSRGCLTVAADGAAWAAEVSMLESDLKKRLGACLGDGVVKKLRVQSRPGGFDAGNRAGIGPRGRGGRPAEGGKDPEQCMPASLLRLEDENLRDALARLLRASSTSEQYEQEDK